MLLQTMARSVLTAQIHDSSNNDPMLGQPENLIVVHPSSTGLPLDHRSADVVLWLSAPNLLNQQLRLLESAMTLLRPDGTIIISIPFSEEKPAQKNPGPNETNLIPGQKTIIDALETTVGNVTLLKQALGTGSQLIPVEGYQPPKENSCNIAPDNNPIVEHFDTGYLVAIASRGSQPLIPPLGLLSNRRTFIVQPIEPHGASSESASLPTVPTHNITAPSPGTRHATPNPQPSERHTAPELGRRASSTAPEYVAPFYSPKLDELKTIADITSTLLAGVVQSANTYRAGEASAHERIEQLTKELEAIKRSRSWQVTAIPRKLAHMLRRYSASRHR